MKKKVVLVMLALQFVLAGTVGCVNNNTQEDVSSTTEVSSDSNANPEQSQVSGFDFDRIVNNIILDGEKIYLPITLNELGDEYAIDDIWDMENGYDTAVLLKNGKQLALVTQVHDKETDVRDKPFYGISSLKSGMGNTFISFDGINEGDNIKKVKELYGEPTEFRMDSRPIVLGDVYEYEYTDSDGVRFNTNEKGEIIYMCVSFKNLVK